DGEVLAAVLAELPQADRTQWSGKGDGVSAIELLVSTGLVSSKSEARRTVKEGGASVNNVKVQDPEKVYTREDALAGRHLLVRRGKKNMAAADLTG
ncbi:S4 domain-containing protein, partial [Streptococcus suis]